MENTAKNFESIASISIRRIQDALMNLKWRASITKKGAIAQAEFIRGRILKIRLESFQDRGLAYAHVSIGINNRVFANQNFGLQIRNQKDIRTSGNIISNWVVKKLKEKKII